MGPLTSSDQRGFFQTNTNIFANVVISEDRFSIFDNYKNALLVINTVDAAFNILHAACPLKRLAVAGFYETAGAV